ncbi:hypothetical protein Tco_0567572 [Tanacetum coccineum]
MTHHASDAYSDRTHFGGVTDWYPKPSVGSSTSQIILFDTIPAEIPAETPVIPPVAPEVEAARVASPAGVLDLTSKDSAASGSLERPPSQDPYEEIPLGRPYCTQPNGVLKIMNTRKRVQALPSGHLASRYPPDHSSLDHFSSDSLSDSSSDSSSGHSLLDSSFSSEDSSFNTPATISAGPSHKRCRGYVAASHYDDSTKGSYEAYTEPIIDSDVQEDIDADTATAKTAAALEVGIRIEADVGVKVGIGIEREDEVEEEAKTEDRDRIEVLEMDNMRLQEMLCVKRERVDSLRRHMSYTQEDLRWIRMSRYYDRADFRRLKTFAMRRLGLFSPLGDSGDEHEDDNGNGNEDGGNKNRNPNVNVGGVVPVTRECTYQDFVKCQALNIKGTEGVVGLTRLFKKMENVFYISNCPQKYQVKYAMLCRNVMIWWNFEEDSWDMMLLLCILEGA